MGSDLKQGFISSLKSAWQTLNEFARAHTSSTQLQEELEKVANQIKEEEEKEVVEGMFAMEAFPWRAVKEHNACNLWETVSLSNLVRLGNSSEGKYVLRIPRHPSLTVKEVFTW